MTDLDPAYTCRISVPMVEGHPFMDMVDVFALLDGTAFTEVFSVRMPTVRTSSITVEVGFRAPSPKAAREQVEAAVGDDRWYDSMWLLGVTETAVVGYWGPRPTG